MDTSAIIKSLMPSSRLRGIYGVLFAFSTNIAQHAGFCLNAHSIAIYCVCSLCMRNVYGS